MKSALLWVVTVSQTTNDYEFNLIFTNKDDAVNEYQIRCPEEITINATLNKVTIQGETTRELASACVKYGAYLCCCNNVDGPGNEPVKTDTVETYSSLTENTIATEVECV